MPTSTIKGREKRVPLTAPANGSSVPVRGFATALASLLLAFAWPLYDLAAFAYGSELFSHILIVPLISGYLIWSSRATLPAPASSGRAAAVLLLAAGAAVIAVYLALRASGWSPARQDALAVTTLAFVLGVAGVCGWFLGGRMLRALAFPLGLLLFLIPIPTPALAAIETFMQHGSGAAAHAMFRSIGTPVFYYDLHFQLPGIRLHVAPECSGIRSTLALLIVSVVTGRLFLRSSVSRAVLVLAVIPLALVRNGFRIFIIGELCVRVGPHMVDSYLHRQGGPIFFALSLVPFFLLLFLLLRIEAATRRRHSPTAVTQPASAIPPA
jgi:exosortase C (VPDSG-CTERM-specific)